MENQKCPVCETEYLEDKDRCDICGWILKDLRKMILTTENLVEFQAEINTIAKNIWKQLNDYHVKKRIIIRQELESQIEQLTQEKKQLEFQIETEKHNQIPPENNTISNSIKREDVLSDITPVIKNIIKEILNQEIDNKINPQFLLILKRLEALAKEQNINSLKPISQSDHQILDETPVDNVNNSHKSIEILLTQEEKDLVGSYNDNIDLTEFITEVSETEESLTNRRDGSQKLAIFKKERRGNYWMITVQDRHYLVPNKKKLKINEYNYSTIIAIFEYRGYVTGKSDDFMLIKPGKISLLITNEYQLEQRGILTNLDEIIALSVEKNNQEIAPIISTLEEDLVNYYNNKINDLMQYITEVSETKDSISNRQNGSQELAIFKKESRGNYWIITVQDRYYLVPSKKLKINEHSYNKIITICEFHGYQLGKSENFILKKPGKVSLLKGNEYQLEKLCVLEF